MLVLKRKDSDIAVGDLIGPRVTVGRDPTNDIVLDDASVSGYHAVLYVENDDCTLADLGSTNGSFVNGRRVTGRTRFVEGDNLSFGAVNLDAGDTKRRLKSTVVMPVVQIESTLTGRSGATLRWVSDTRRCVFVAQGTELQIGRAPENGLVIDSDTVSVHHASIKLSNTGAVVQDHKSINGTYVNGERVERQNLRHGDRIRFDTEEYLFEMPLGASAATQVNPAVQVHVANTRDCASSSIGRPSLCVLLGN